MGKNSLIKSTSKKTAEKEPEEKQKKAAAKSKKTAKAAAPKAKKAAKKTAAKAKSTAKKKATAKSAAKKTPKAKSAAKKPAAQKKKAPAKKPVSAKELLFQQFESWKPKTLYTPPAERDAKRDFTAPPMISAGSASETARQKKLLFLRFSPEALKAAAKESGAAKKAAAEKAAAEKAAAEKAAAEKAAAEKAAAEVSVSYTPPPEKAPADPMEKAFKYGAAGFAILLLILIGYSFANTGHYYLDSANGGLKIYQGRFAPMGKELIMTLPGVKLVEPAEAVYTRTQVFPLIYNYYVDKADALLAAPGLPDYEGIRRYLKEALKYATSNDLRSAIYARLDGIELMTLLYKADVASRKPNIDSLEEALDYLNEASRLEIDASQAELIDQKRESVRARIEQLKAEEAAAEAESTPAAKE